MGSYHQLAEQTASTHRLITMTRFIVSVAFLLVAVTYVMAGPFGPPSLSDINQPRETIRAQDYPYCAKSCAARGYSGSCKVCIPVPGDKFECEPALWPCAKFVNASG